MGARGSAAEQEPVVMEKEPNVDTISINDYYIFAYDFEMRKVTSVTGTTVTLYETAKRNIRQQMQIAAVERGEPVIEDDEEDVNIRDEEELEAEETIV